jgi:hypothetical protein
LRQRAAPPICLEGVDAPRTAEITMDEGLAAMMRRSRRHIREWKRGIAFVESGYLTFRVNGVDASADHVATLRAHIASHQQLIAQYDPHGLTADDRIDFSGAVDPRRAISEFHHGRYVVFRLTDDGAADPVRGFDTEAEARRILVGRPDHLLGRVADDGWSVERLL